MQIRGFSDVKLLIILLFLLFPVPDEVSSLQFDDVSDRAVRVSWVAPKKSNGVLIGYKLTYQIKDMADTLLDEILPSNVTSILVEHLQVS